MASPHLPLVRRDPEVPWPAIIEALGDVGISLRQIGGALGVGHTTVQRWQQGACPNFEDGAAFSKLIWRKRDRLPPDLVTQCAPKSLDLPEAFRGGTNRELQPAPDRIRQRAQRPLPRPDNTARDDQVIAPASDSLEAVMFLWQVADVVET